MTEKEVRTFVLNANGGSLLVFPLPLRAAAAAAGTTATITTPWIFAPAESIHDTVLRHGTVRYDTTRRVGLTRRQCAACAF
jgi:hypothetical protein